MIRNIFVLAFVVLGFVACDDPYENVSQPKHYTGNPFVSLSSEQAAISLGVKSSNHTAQAGVFKDSLILSHAQENDLKVQLELVATETQGDIDVNFSFQKEVSIEAGKNFGSYTVRVLDLPANDLSRYKLSIRIKETNNPEVIAGLYGAKRKNEARQKRFKTYSFKQ